MDEYREAMKMFIRRVREMREAQKQFKGNPGDGELRLAAESAERMVDLVCRLLLPDQTGEISEISEVIARHA